MRRFINLVDALYDASVMVVFLAQAAPMQMLEISDEERTSWHDDEVSHSTSLETIFNCMRLSFEFRAIIAHIS
jgi:predicted ATPase